MPAGLQVLMLRLKSDLVKVLLAACQGRLKDIALEWSDDPALVVVLASKGYPGNYKKNTILKNLEEAESFGKQVKVFHAGTALDAQQNMVAVGGRVLGVTAMGKDIAEAQAKAYQVVDCIDWPEGFCRRDIGWRAVARLNTLVDFYKSESSFCLILPAWRRWLPMRRVFEILPKLLGKVFFGQRSFLVDSSLCTSQRD
jgi:phosphoribosylamine-glycine ligase